MDHGQTETREVARLERQELTPTTLGLTLVVECVEMVQDSTVANNDQQTARNLLRAVEEFQTSIINNQSFSPNYGERYHAAERIRTGFVESTVNQMISKLFCKQQQMAWTPRGAHLSLPIRTRVLTGEWETTFRQGYPGFTPCIDERIAA
jgi:hypothetical protein